MSEGLSRNIRRRVIPLCQYPQFIYIPFAPSPRLVGMDMALDQMVDG